MSTSKDTSYAWTIRVKTLDLFNFISTFAATNTQIYTINEERLSPNSRFHRLPSELINQISTILRSTTSAEIAAAWPEDRLSCFYGDYEEIRWMTQAEEDELNCLCPEPARRARVLAQYRRGSRPNAYTQPFGRFFIHEGLNMPSSHVYVVKCKEYASNARKRYEEECQKVKDSFCAIGSEELATQCLKTFGVRPLFIFSFLIGDQLVPYSSHILQHKAMLDVWGNAPSKIYAYLAIPASPKDCPLDFNVWMNEVHWSGKTMSIVNTNYPPEKSSDRKVTEPFMRALKMLELEWRPDHHDKRSFAHAKHESIRAMSECVKLAPVLRIITIIKSDD